MYIQKNRGRQGSSFRGGFEPDTLAVILREMQGENFGSTPEEKVRNLGKNLYEDIVDTATYTRDSDYYDDDGYGDYEGDDFDDPDFEEAEPSTPEPTEPIDSYIPYGSYKSPEGVALMYLTATQQATQTLNPENQIDHELMHVAVQSFNEAEIKRDPDYATKTKHGLGQNPALSPAETAYYEAVQTHEFDDIMVANMHKEPGLKHDIAYDVIRSSSSERDAITHLSQFADKLYELEKGEGSKPTELGRSRTVKDLIPDMVDGVDISGLNEMIDKDIANHKKNLPYLLSSVNDKNSRQRPGFEPVTKEDVGIDF